MMIGNLCAALASNYWVLMIARFISGLPHGAYFGVGSIVAEKLADKGRGSEAVSIMIAGMTIANLFGVPLGTALSTMLSWRLTFLLVGCWGIAILYYKMCIRDSLQTVDKTENGGGIHTLGVDTRILDEGVIRCV